MKTPDISIIEKVLDNEATTEEVKLVTSWFQTKEGLAWLSERMDKDERQIQLGNEAEWIDHEIPSSIIYQQIMKKIRFQKIRRRIFQAAAIFIPIILFLGLFYKIDNQIDILANDEDFEEVIVPNGEKLRVMFQDGSSVYLNSGSRIRFPKKFTYNNRKVELDGEGWFEVQKNRNRPFIVSLDKMNIKVLGTEFNVKAYANDNDISVSLLNGLVELSSKFFKTFNLKPGEKATYDKTTHFCKISHPKNIENCKSWKNNRFIFEGASLNEVINTLSRAYNVKFKIQDKEVLEYTYTIKIKHKDITTSLKELEKIVPIRFIQTNDSIFVHKK